MRKMRLQKREVTGRKELLDIVAACDTVRIGMTDEDGMFIVPVNFGYEWKENGELLLYFHSAKEGRKVDALKKNPSVAFEMDCGHRMIRGDYACSYSLAYQSIMGKGSVRLVTDAEEKAYGLHLLMDHMAPGAQASFAEEQKERVNVYCIEIQEFTGKQRSV